MNQTTFHTPVLKKESLDALNVIKGGWYVDCNLGGGGHSGEILKRGGKVIGIDLDQEAIDYVSKEFDGEIKNGNLLLFKANFSRLTEILEKAQVKEVAGVLFDLGVSSHQLEKAQRGFSFNVEASLDMRMDQSFGARAQDLINGLGEGELVELFTKLGEESYSRPIAKKIVEERKKSLITTTGQLARLVASVKRTPKGSRIHPATQVFQALRIAVNDELNSLREALPAAFAALGKGGTIVVISFHSLEDRIVKNYFRELEDQNLAKNLFKKPQVPTDEEILTNPRSRSSKLRAVRKL